MPHAYRPSHFVAAAKMLIHPFQRHVGALLASGAPLVIWFDCAQRGVICPLPLGRFAAVTVDRAGAATLEWSSDALFVTYLEERLRIPVSAIFAYEDPTTRRRVVLNEQLDHARYVEWFPGLAHEMSKPTLTRPVARPYEGDAPRFCVTPKTPPSSDTYSDLIGWGVAVFVSALLLGLPALLLRLGFLAPYLLAGFVGGSLMMLFGYFMRLEANGRAEQESARIAANASRRANEILHEAREIRDWLTRRAVEETRVVLPLAAFFMATRRIAGYCWLRSILSTTVRDLRANRERLFRLKAEYEKTLKSEASDFPAAVGLVAWWEHDSLALRLLLDDFAFLCDRESTEASFATGVQADLKRRAQQEAAEHASRLWSGPLQATTEHHRSLGVAASHASYLPDEHPRDDAERMARERAAEVARDAVADAERREARRAAERRGWLDGVNGNGCSDYDNPDYVNGYRGASSMR